MTNQRSSFALVLAALALAAGAAGSRAWAENIDPLNNGSQYAYAENVGWINFEPVGGSGAQVDDFELTGYLWAENVGWISLSCKNTSSCGTVEYGVRNNGSGVLSGFAWAENVGWVNLAPSTAGVSIDVVAPLPPWMVKVTSKLGQPPARVYTGRVAVTQDLPALIEKLCNSVPGFPRAAPVPVLFSARERFPWSSAHGRSSSLPL